MDKKEIEARKRRIYDPKTKQYIDSETGEYIEELNENPERGSEYNTPSSGQLGSTYIKPAGGKDIAPHLKQSFMQSSSERNRYLALEDIVADARDRNLVMSDAEKATARQIIAKYLSKAKEKGTGARIGGVIKAYITYLTLLVERNPRASQFYPSKENWIDEFSDGSKKARNVHAADFVRFAKYVGYSKSQLKSIIGENASVKLLKWLE
ncbi:MAG: hypothetical protein QXW39_06235 [Candidatus Bathyarchaeia archaeon]